ncbi:hypothetical protein R3I93_015132 [Phoxinus phoxinus]|uniref:Ig-like domain-containing protein n=1 Tax=Phoxinus phoxinus TaxID=58324 RepID=A0AAN9CKU0_9TELE
MLLGQGIMREFGETLLITVCFLHLLDRGIGESGTCKHAECLNCLFSNASQNSTNDVRENCTIKDFNVTIKSQTNETTVDEGSDVTLTCVHDLPNVSINSFRWEKDNELQGETSETFQIKTILESCLVDCNVDSICGVFNSNITITVKPGSHMVVILVCVGAAAALLMMFAIGMKISLRRGQVQSQARKRQRQQNMENIHSTVNTVTSYY